MITTTRGFHLWSEFAAVAAAAADAAAAAIESPAAAKVPVESIGKDQAAECKPEVHETVR